MFKNYARKHRKLARMHHADPMLLNLANRMDAIVCNHNGYPLCYSCTRRLERIKLSVVGTTAHTLNRDQLDGLYRSLAVRVAAYFVSQLDLEASDAASVEAMNGLIRVAEQAAAFPNKDTVRFTEALAVLALDIPCCQDGFFMLPGEAYFEQVVNLWYGNPETHFHAVSWIVNEFRTMANLVVDDEFSALEAEAELV